MNIRYEKTPESFFTAVLQKQINGGTDFLVEQKVYDEPDLFSWQTETAPNKSILECHPGGSRNDTSCSTPALNDILTNYLSLFPGLNPFDNPDQYDEFLERIFYALHHGASRKVSVIEKTILQSMNKGVSYVLEKMSMEAVQFARLASEVAREIHQAKAFIRLVPLETPKILFGEWELNHETIYFIMKHFLRRFPEYTILLLTGTQAYAGQGSEIWEETIDRRQLNLPAKKDEFLDEWLTFYQSQYIPQRKNIKLFKKHVPQKYWKFMEEVRGAA